MLRGQKNGESKLVKISLCAIIKQREILDEWLRQLSPLDQYLKERLFTTVDGLISFYKQNLLAN